MTDDRFWLLTALLALSLPLASLIARRVAFGQVIRMIAAWTLIFGFMFVAFLYRGDVLDVWNRAKAELTGSALDDATGSIRLRMEEDGHFWVNASVNGTTVRFMVDSGATRTTMSANDAKRARLAIPADEEAETVETANGPMQILPTSAKEIVVGSFALQDFEIDVSPHKGDTNLLGMNFLSELKSWKVEGGQMILVP